MSAGANVKVSANSSPYQQAMKEAREATKELASQFSVASAQAKLMGSTTDQLKVKQQELTAKIEAQNKVTALHHSEVERLSSVLETQKKRQVEVAEGVEKAKKAYEEQKKATGEDSEETQKLGEQVKKLETQQKGLETQIANTETKLSKATVAENNSKAAALEMEAALKKTNAQLKDQALDEFSKKLDTAQEKLKKVQSAANVVSGAAVAAGTAAVAAWNEVDEGADAVIKATGATGDAAEELEQTYKNVAGSFAADFTTIGSALGEVNTRFGYTGDKAEACTTQFLKFAEITGTDATTAVQLVSRAMGDAGIEADDYGGLLDQLAVACQASGISVDSLTGYITKYGAPMRALGFDTAESIAIFAQWEKTGVNTEIAFSGMKTAIGNWSKEGKDAREEFKKTLDEIGSCPDIASATTKAIEVFGQKAGPDLADAIQGGRFEYSDFLALLESSQGTVTATYGAMEDGGTEAQVAMNNLKLAGAELGDVLQQKASPYIALASEKLQEITQWLGSMDDGTKDNIVRVGLFAAALAPATAAVSGLVKGVQAGVDAYKLIHSGISAVATALTSETAQHIATTAAQTAHNVATAAGTVAQNAMAGAQAALNAVMAVNPILLVVAAIAALAAGLVLAYNKCEWFRDGVDAAISKVTEVFGKLADGAKQTVENIKSGLTNLKNDVGEKLTAVKQHFSEKFQAAKQATKDAIDNVKSTISNGLSTAKSTVQSKLQETKQNWSTGWDNIKSTASSALTNVKNNMQQQLSAMKSAYDSHGGGVKGAVAAYLSAVRSNYDNVYSALNTLTGGRFGTIASTMQAKMQQAASSAASILGNIQNSFQSKMDGARNVVSNAIAAIKGFFNFSWSLPHLNMPHPYISGHFSLNPPSVPSFGINWYKNGGIMTQPTVFGATGNTILAGGEAGAEAILPLAPFYTQLSQMLEDKIAAAMRAARVVVYVQNQLDGDDLAAKVTPRVSEQMADEAEQIR